MDGDQQCSITLIPWNPNDKAEKCLIQQTIFVKRLVLKTITFTENILTFSIEF